MYKNYSTSWSNESLVTSPTIQKKHQKKLRIAPKLFPVRHHVELQHWSHREIGFRWSHGTHCWTATSSSVLPGIFGTYIMWLTIWILSVFQIQSSLCFPITRHQARHVCISLDIHCYFRCVPQCKSVLWLHEPAIFCSPLHILADTKSRCSQVKKGLAFTDSLLQLSWSDISAGRSASIPRMVCLLGTGSTLHATGVNFFLVQYTRRQEQVWQNKQMQRLHLCWKCSNCTKSIDCFQP